MSIPVLFSMKKNILFGVIAAVIIAGGAAFFYWQNEAPNVQTKTNLQPAYRTQIDGLRFYELYHGRRVISITADRFAIGKGKLGFFSTGLTRKATIQNTVIEIYTAIPTTVAPTGKLSPHPGKTPNFTRLFAAETFSALLPVRNIAEIEITPVTIRLRDDDAVLTSIFAVKAVLLFREKQIRFTGQVRVASGDAELLTEELVFIPETSLLQTDQPFLLKRGSVALRGARLTTDIFLKPGTAK
ncbi:MAG: LPS export ABC transporter periplasmic protein LptC [Syntrophobacterales bacterium]|nr:LPS export ABC transporter periplasmic protein LptC [Syntrophobacterales bacterium]